MKFDLLGSQSVSAQPTSFASISSNSGGRLARLCLALTLAAPLGVMPSRLLAQDAPPAAAQISDADLLKQGLAQYKNDLYEEAQDTLTQIKSENLSVADRNTFVRVMKDVEAAAGERKAARAAFQKGEEALAAGRLVEARDQYKSASSNHYADAGTRAKAAEQIALVAARQKDAVAQQKSLYQQAAAEFAAGNLADARPKFQALKDAGFDPGWFQKNPTDYLKDIDKKQVAVAAVAPAPTPAPAPEAPAAKPETPAAPASLTAKEYYLAGKVAFNGKNWAAARENFVKAQEAGYKAGLFEDSAATYLDRTNVAETAAKAQALAQAKAAEEAAAKAKAEEAAKAKAAQEAAAVASAAKEAEARKKEAGFAYDRGVQLYRKGNYAEAREQLTKARELGYRTGWFEDKPEVLIARIDQKDATAKTVAVATPAPKPETPVAKPETPAAKPETPAVKPETPVVKQETPATKPPVPTPLPVTASSTAKKELQTTANVEKIRQQQIIYEANRIVENARAEQAKGNYQRALELYNDALVKDPGNEVALAGRGQMLELTGSAAVPSPMIERQDKIVRARKQQITYAFNTAIGEAQEAIKVYDFGVAATALERAKVARDMDPMVFTLDEVRQMESTLTLTNQQMSQAIEAKAIVDKQKADDATKQIEIERMRNEAIARQKTVKDLIESCKRLTTETRYEQALGVTTQIIALDPTNEYANAIRPWLMDQTNIRKQRAYLESFDQNMTRTILAIDEKLIPYDDLLTYPPNWPDLSEMRELTVQQERGIRSEDQAVISQLDRRLPELKFDNNGFAEVIDFLRDITGTNIFVNWKALEGAGIDRNAPVTARLRDVKFSKALSTILSIVSGPGNAKLNYTVDEGVVTISTEEDLGRNLTTQVFDIRDLIVQIPNFDNAPQINMQDFGNQNQGGAGQGLFGQGQGAGGGGMAQETGVLSRGEIVGEIIKLIVETVAADSWKDNGGRGALREMSGQLIVSQTPENHRKIMDLLEQLRESRAIQVLVEARYLAISRNWMESIAVNFNFTLNTDGSWDHVSAVPFTRANPSFTTNPNPALPLGNVAPLRVGANFTMDSWEADLFLQAVQATRYTTTLNAPRIVLFNGQRSFMTTGTQQSFVSGLNAVAGSRTIGYTPQISTAVSGTTLDVAATVSADRRYVTLTLRPRVAGPLNLNTFQTAAGGVQLPSQDIIDIRTTVSVPDGGTFAFGGQVKAGEIELEEGVPILSKIPFVKRLFSNRGTAKNEEILLILVKPTIVIQREVEQKQFPLLSSRILQ